MSEPITTTLALGVAGNLATSLVQRLSSDVKAAPARQALQKLGVVPLDFEQRLEVALREAIQEFFSSSPKFDVKAVHGFLKDRVAIAQITDAFLDRKAFNIDILCDRLVRYIEMPASGAPAEWARNEVAATIIVDFLEQLERSLGRQSDQGVLWLSRQVGSLMPLITALVTDVELLRQDLAGLFDASLRSKQKADAGEFEVAYLEHVKQRYGRISTPGARELHGVNQNLTIAYISLNVIARDQAHPKRAEQFLLENPSIVVRGPAGSGKTTLMSWIVLQCTHTQPHDGGVWDGGIPFFIPLRTVSRTDQGVPKPERFVEYSVDTHLFAKDPPRDWVHDVLKRQRRGVLMFDGVDELPPSRRPAFWDWLDRFVSEYPGNRVIVTSRTLPGTLDQGGIKRTEQWNPPATFVDAHLQEMSNADVTSFVHHWHDAVDRARLDPSEVASLIEARDALPLRLVDAANRRIRDLCSTPLLCAMVCVLHWREEGYLPRYRVDLYDKCCDMLIEARDLKRKILVAPDALSALTKNDKEMVLQRLAFEMMHNKPDGDENFGNEKDSYRIEISREKAIEWIKPKIASFQSSETHGLEAGVVLDYLIERTGLLREPARGLIDFPHRTFQEYLAACAAGAEGQEDFLAKQADDDQWHETIMLAAGTPTGGVLFGRNLIEALVRRAERHVSPKERSQRIRKTCLALALGCLENLKQHEPVLRARVLSHLGELVPPSDETGARIVSVAGEAAVPHLDYEKWKDERTATVAACAMALRLIGTANAIHSLRDGYLQDPRESVVAEVCRANAAPYVEIPFIVAAVNDSGELPRFAVPRDLSVLEGLSNLKKLVLAGPVPKNIQILGRLSTVERIEMSGIDLSDASAFNWPPDLLEVVLIRMSGDNLSWVPSLSKLSTITLLLNETLEKIDDIFEEKSNISTARVLACPIESISGIERLLNLRELTIDSCQKIKNVDCLSLSKELRVLRLDDVPGADVSKIDFSRLTSLALISVRCEGGILDLSSCTDMLNLKLSQISDLKEIRGLRNLDQLSSLQIDRCALVEPLPPVNELLSLTKLILGGVHASTLPEFRNLPLLRELTVFSMPAVRGSEFLRGCNQIENLELIALPAASDISCIDDCRSLKSLALDFLPRVDSLSPLSKLSRLQRFSLEDCDAVISIAHGDLPENLEEISLTSCANLKSIEFMASLKKLRIVEISHCDEIQSFEPLSDVVGLEKIILSEYEGAFQPPVPAALAGLVERRYPYGRHMRHEKLQLERYGAVRYRESGIWRRRVSLGPLPGRP